MKIAEGLDVLELHSSMSGPASVLHPTLIWDENSAILVDTGLPGQLQSIREEMEKVGIPFEKLDKIIITHQDMDHIGNLSKLINESEHKIEVLAHEEERPYIDGEKRPIKMTPERMAQIEEQMKTLPEDKRNAMKAMYANLSAKVDVLLKDGEELPYFGGITVIHTPGHTPGHICLYLKKYKALVTGDALNAPNGVLQGPNPVFTYNMEEALNSLKKLTKYDIKTVICYHGGVVMENVNDKIAQLANHNM